MPEKKKQHYVPQFHLKNFSLLGERINISLSNKTSGKYIISAAIKNQSQKPYFYGKDLEIENLLGSLEEDVSPIIKSIITNISLPKINSSEYDILLRFILISKHRTLFTSDQLNEMFDASMKNIWSKDESKKEFLSNHYFEFNNAAVFALERIFGMTDKFSTLRIKLLITKEGGLISSDNPVVPYNIFLEERNHHGGHYGISSKGIMYYFPISSKYCLVIYDSKTYKIGNRKDYTIKMNIKDLKEINLITFINCHKNVYFNGAEISEVEINEIREMTNDIEDPNKLVIKEYPQYEEDSNKTRALVHHYRTNLKIRHKPSFLKLTKHAKNFVIRDEAVVIR